MILADCGESGSDVVAPDPGSPTAETPPITRSAATPGTFADEADAACEYLIRGYAPIPLNGRRTKEVTRPNWPHERYTSADVEAFRGRNIGLLLGPPSGGVTDVDLDCREAIRAAEVLLPKTAMVSGRRTARRSHHNYLCNPSPESLSLSDPLAAPGEKAKLVELRTGWNADGPKGEQTMAPPSIHPDTGEVVMWEEFGEPAVVGAADLEKAVKAVAAAALLGRHWATGNRHTAALALAGALLRDGRTVAEVERFMTAVCAAAQDEEVRDRIAAVRATARNLAEGKNATGWKRLAELLDGKVVARVREWLGVRDPRPSSAPPAEVGQWTPFPTHALPPVLRAYVETAAEAYNCDPSYSALPLLTVVAGAIGTTCRVQLKSGWLEPPTVWAVSIGVSGATKSPPYRDIEEMAQDLNDRLTEENRRAATDHAARLEERQALLDAGVDAGPEPAAPPEACSRSRTPRSRR